MADRRPDLLLSLLLNSRLNTCSIILLLFTHMIPLVFGKKSINNSEEKTINIMRRRNI